MHLLPHLHLSDGASWLQPISYLAVTTTFPVTELGHFCSAFTVAFGDLTPSFQHQLKPGAVTMLSTPSALTFFPSVYRCKCSKGSKAGVWGAWGNCHHPMPLHPCVSQQAPKEVLVPRGTPEVGLPHHRVQQLLHSPPLSWPRGSHRLPTEGHVCGDTVSAFPRRCGVLPLWHWRPKQHVFLQYEPDPPHR